MTDWKSIWNARKFDPSAESVLTALMRADGFDTKMSAVTEDAWRAFVIDLADRLEIAEGDRVFEVGCGSGALLYPLHEVGVQVGGIDQSSALIDAARSVMPEGQWIVGDASELDPAEPWDHVVSMGVFMYFPDHDYARGVLARMAAKATRTIAILDVPDVAMREEAMRFRRGTLGEREYEEKYRGLDHRYYDERWFLRTLTEAGVSAVQFSPQQLEGYPHARFRFNVFARL